MYPELLLPHHQVSDTPFPPVIAHKASEEVQELY